METNIILCGVGGQGILSISVVVDMAALKQGWHFKQAEVHGMSQRGGEVISHLRVADHPIHSDLVPKGSGTLILSVEPMESLRYVEYLGPEGALVSSVDPFVNISNYPDHQQVLEAIASLKTHVLVPADGLAREAGSGKAANMVLLGAASPWLGIKDELVEAGIQELFARKGERIQNTNVAAFRAGKAAGEAYRACLKAEIPSRAARALVGRLEKGVLAPNAIPHWKALFAGPMGPDVIAAMEARGAERVKGEADLPKAILASGKAGKVGEMLFPKAA
jgi:indolepyruvate ferredoxin oxidoreductase beta subunit